MSNLLVSQEQSKPKSLEGKGRVKKRMPFGNKRDRDSTRWLDKGRKPPRPPPSKFVSDRKE